MSQHFWKCFPWLQQPRQRLAVDQHPYDCAATSKRQGMLWAVKHLKEQLLQSTNAQHLHSNHELYDHAVQHAYQQAVEALDQLQLTLGGMAGVKRGGGKLSVGKTVSGLRAVNSLFIQVKNGEPRAGGPAFDGRKGKIELTKGAATPVPEVPGLTMGQMVAAATKAGLCPLHPASWWFSS
jgi:hypothetical protein